MRIATRLKRRKTAPKKVMRHREATLRSVLVANPLLICSVLSESNIENAREER